MIFFFFFVFSLFLVFKNNFKNLKKTAHDLSTSSGYSLNTGYPTWKNSEHNGDACCSVVEVLDALNQPNPGLKVQGFGWTVQDEGLKCHFFFLKNDKSKFRIWNF